MTGRRRSVAVPFAIAMAMLASGCGDAANIDTASARAGAAPSVIAPASAVPVPAGAADTGWSTGCPIPTDSPKAPIGLTRDALLARYGTPASEAKFVLGDAVDPSRLTVRNVLSAPADLKRSVLELAWEHDGCTLTVWLARRGSADIAVQTLRGPSDGEH